MDKLPENPEPGKCYVKCVTPDLYKNESVTVITKPASTKLTVVPAQYKTVTETVVLKPASKKSSMCQQSSKLSQKKLRWFNQAVPFQLYHLSFQDLVKRLR